MKSIAHFFHTYPIFRTEEFAAFKKEQGIVNVESIKQALHYYVRTKRIISLRQGVYAVLSPGENAEDYLVDPYLLTANITSDSVLAYHTALELHGVAYSSFQEFSFLTAHKVIPFDYHGYHFRPVAIPTALINNHCISTGVESINRQGLAVSLTSLARTYVDVIVRPQMAGGWEEVCRSLDNMAVLNIEEVISYCLALKNKSAAAKVGYFLEQRQGAFAVTKDQLDHLRLHIPKSPTYLHNNSNEKFQLIKRWNLIVPTSVIQRTWEEPNENNF